MQAFWKQGMNLRVLPPTKACLHTHIAAFIVPADRAEDVFAVQLALCMRWFDLKTWDTIGGKECAAYTCSTVNTSKEAQWTLAWEWKFFDRYIHASYAHRHSHSRMHDTTQLHDTTLLIHASHAHRHSQTLACMTQHSSSSYRSSGIGVRPGVCSHKRTVSWMTALQRPTARHARLSSPVSLIFSRLQDERKRRWLVLRRTKGSLAWMVEHSC